MGLALASVGRKVPYISEDFVSIVSLVQSEKEKKGWSRSKKSEQGV